MLNVFEHLQFCLSPNVLAYVIISLASRETLNEGNELFASHLLHFPISRYHLLVPLKSPGMLGGEMTLRLDGIDFLSLFWAQMFTLYIADSYIS